MAYLPLSTANLPDPVIDPAQGASPEDYFNTVLYTGNGSTNAITGVGFQPDWVWGKSRSHALNHFLTDAVRGATETLKSNTTDAEETQLTALTSFDSDGFTMGSSGGFNGSGYTYVAWNWKANGSGVSNTDGSITSTVSANTTSGFSIVSYTGTGALGTVGHGLGATPELIIIKSREDGSSNWAVYSAVVGAGKNFFLNSTNDSDTDGAIFFNSTAPTSSVFTLGGSGAGQVNENGETFIAYCFAPKEGYSKFGTYDDAVTGSDYENTSPFIYTGFKPAFVMIKGDANGREWVMYDNKRTPDNGVYLRANTSAAEQTDATNHDISFNANGFKIRGGSGDINTTGESYIYMAFADQPLKYANGGTE